MTLSTPTVKYEKRERVAWVTLNRPEQLNALNREIRQGIGEAMVEASGDDDVLVVIVVGGGGRAFSAGADLKEMAQQDVGGAPGAQTYTGGAQVSECPKPVIAAIDGYCLAGGLQLASRCDIRIATEKSRFGMIEARRSLTAVGIIDTPEMFVSPGEALWILLTADHMTAKRAYDIGLIQALVPDRDALFAEAERVANEIKMNAPLAVQFIKHVVKTKMNLPTPPEGVLPLDHLRDLTAAGRERVAKSEDRLEGPKAFAEKRAPNWKMR